MSDKTYRVLRFDELTVQRNRGEDIARQIQANGAGAAHQTFGVWLPMIGVSVNVVTAATNWTDEPPAPSYKDDAIVGVRSRLFDVLARGQEPCTREGAYTHRWFVVRPEDVETVTQQSVEAWKSMEADTEARITGFWLCRERNERDEATILMIVYYPNLAAWETSRYWKPLPNGQVQPNRNVWGSLFQQRRDTQIDSWVTMHRLAK
ncbi:hypothetical protein [Afipia sp. P52-10]|uniref:hypothetical protein n=1 Tax=Afipia sp. P52-10 TaxID=1429916 RepID=UPI0004B269E1|nr:hypothetical protein [Afipia sp. P52-10]